MTSLGSTGHFLAGLDRLLDRGLVRFRCNGFNNEVSRKGFFVSACSVSLGLCWKSGIAAEVIGTPDGSIGAVFYQAKIFLQTSELLAWTVVVVAVSVAFEKLFMFLLRLVLKKLKMEDVLNGKRA